MRYVCLHCQKEITSIFSILPQRPGYYSCTGLRDDVYAGEEDAGRKVLVLYLPCEGRYCNSRRFGLSLPYHTKQDSLYTHCLLRSLLHNFF